MKIYRFLKILFMFLKHGINPFLPVASNKKKMVQRLSRKDKEWIVNNAKGNAKYYFENMFNIER